MKPVSWSFVWNSEILRYKYSNTSNGHKSRIFSYQQCNLVRDQLVCVDRWEGDVGYIDSRFRRIQLNFLSPSSISKLMLSIWNWSVLTIGDSLQFSKLWIFCILHYYRKQLRKIPLLARKLSEFMQFEWYFINFCKLSGIYIWNKATEFIDK